MLAILAKSFIFAYQRPRVAILSTGDELADLDERFSETKSSTPIVMELRQPFRRRVAFLCC
jgi:Molybdopterin biosynthesis enzyme